MRGDIFFFELVGFGFLGRQVGFNPFSIRVIISQGGMDLSQREVSYPVGNLLGCKAELVPNHYAPHGYASSSDARPPPADAWRLSNQAANFHNDFNTHSISVIGGLVGVNRISAENSPAIHRWGSVATVQKSRRDVRTLWLETMGSKEGYLSSLRDFLRIGLLPSDESLGYFHSSLRDTD